MCVGSAYENAHAESFNGTLKRQEINLNEYQTIEESARELLAQQQLSGLSIATVAAIEE